MRSKNQYCLVVMSKAPIAGQVKTRLIKQLGACRAAGFYQQWLSDTMNNMRGMESAHYYLMCAPDIYHHALRRLSKKYGYMRRQQSAGDLGARMASVFSRLCRQYRSVVMVGADCPVLDSGFVQQSFDYLQQDKDLVLGEADDGGYALIGMNNYHASVFRNIPWSTHRVTTITCNRAHQAGLNIAVMDGLWDIDTFKDYRRWLGAR